MPQVLAAACQCLCSLAALQPACARELVAQGSKYFIILEGDLLRRNTATSQHKALYSRYLFTLGQLCRYGGRHTTIGSSPTCSSSVIRQIMRV